MAEEHFLVYFKIFAQRPELIINFPRWKLCILHFGHNVPYLYNCVYNYIVKETYGKSGKNVTNKTV